GTDWVWGMDRLLSVDSNGRQIDEYGHGRLARTWAPQQTDGTVNDIDYRFRSTSVQASGKLYVSDHWLAKTQSLSYVVSDADLYAIGAHGEHWYEPARNLDHVELAIDGTTVTNFTADSTPRTQPTGTLSFDTSVRNPDGSLLFPNGSSHTIT